ncbi:hypothetical protein G9A89_005488 [Geosiphon pyriformis]|nr:hypothetical protein G9A89_005488 [Geosiphon pyriformis]
MELQPTSWMPQHPLKVLINLLINPTNCFLAGATHALKLYNLSLGGDLPDVFQAKNSIAVLDIFGLESYLYVANYVNEHLLNSDLSSVTIYTDSSVKDGWKLQVIVLALKCVSASRSVNLFTDSQALLDLCKSGGGVFSPDFHDKCWIEKEHICCVISKKSLLVIWNKVKGHSGVVENKCANFYVDAAVASKFFLPLVVPYRFLKVEDRPVSGNACHVAKKLFNAVHSVGWEAKCVGSFISVGFCDRFDKAKTFCVWHPDGKIKIWLHQKRLYNLRYPNIACIQCGLVKDSDYMFSCTHDANVQEILLSDASMEWNVVLGISADKNVIAKSLHETGFSINLFTALAKGFVLKDWVADTVSCLGAGFGRGMLVVDFIHCFAESYRSAIWIPTVKLRSYYEKHNLLPQDGSSFFSVSGLSSLWSAGSIRDFGFRLGVYICFRLHLCLTKSDFGFLSSFPVAEILDV